MFSIKNFDSLTSVTEFRKNWQYYIFPPDIFFVVLKSWRLWTNSRYSHEYFSIHSSYCLRFLADWKDEDYKNHKSVYLDFLPRLFTVEANARFCRWNIYKNRTLYFENDWCWLTTKIYFPKQKTEVRAYKSQRKSFLINLHGFWINCTKVYTK